MEFEGDSPAPRRPAPPEPLDTQNITVTPENVVALAVLFRECGDRIAAELAQVTRAIWAMRMWLDDPVSHWVEQEFREHLLDGENAFIKVLQDVYDQYTDVMKALLSVGEQYELTEELIAAGFVDVGESR